MQVTNLEALGTGNKRYRCRVSDGSSSMDAVLGSEAAKVAATGSIQEGGILSAQDYVLNIINDVQKLFITCKPYAACFSPSDVASHGGRPGDNGAPASDALKAGCLTG